MFRRLPALSLCCALLAATWGCAAFQPDTGGIAVGRDRDEPPQIALKRLLRQQARVWSVSYPMLAGGTDLCGDQLHYQYGFWAWTRWDIKPRYRIASMGAYGLDDRLRVVHIIPGSPAATAGLQAGDVIAAVSWHEMAAGRKAGAGLRSALKSETRAGEPLALYVGRGEGVQVLRMVPRLQCDVSLVLTESEEINIFSEGRTVFVTAGLLGFVPDDDQLAVLIGHAVAHVVLGHAADAGDRGLSDEVASWLRELRRAARRPEREAAYAEAGITPSSGPFALGAEIEADSLGLEFAARGGYRVDVAGALWRHIAAQSPRAVLMQSFHPTAPERLSAIDGAAAEIDRKQNAGAAAP